MDNDGVMICPKCGNEMHYKDRFCFHCGYINYDNNRNDFLKKYDKKAKRKLKKEAKKNKTPETKFLNVDVKAEQKTEKKKFYRSIEEYKEDVAKNSERTQKEKINSLIQRIKNIVIPILFILVVVFGYKYIVKSQQVYVDQSIEIVNQIKNKYGKNNFKRCSKSDEYLFEFTSASLKNEYNLDFVSPYMGNEYKGYVLVSKVDGKYKYRIALTDGTFGIREVDIDELKTKNVLPYYRLKVPAIYVECK